MDAVNDTDRKIVNYSTRKHLIQKLVDSEIPPNEIIQITGHKNINSVNNYSTLPATRQQQISTILSNGNWQLLLVFCRAVAFKMLTLI